MEIIDISLSIQKDMILYPGDSEFQLTKVLDMTNTGDEVNLSKIEMSVHTGTHVESPLHFIEDGKTINDLSLSNFYGHCKVIDLTGLNYNNKITKIQLKDKGIDSGIIVLIKTKNSLLYQDKFREDYISLAKDGVKHLVEIGIKAIGIDYLSIGDSEIHQMLLSEGIVVYEGLNLAHVVPGNYIFVGFPLKIVDSEASPTRAVLLKE